MDTLTVKCWKLDCPSPTCLLLALAIARRSRENGACWASQKTLGDDTGLSRKTVQRALGELEAMDPPRVERKERYRDDRSRTTDFIWLRLPEVILEAVALTPKEMLRDLERAKTETGHDDPEGVRMTGGPSTGSPGGGDAESEQKDSMKESKEVRGADAQFSIDGLVEMIWARVGEMGRKRSTKPKVRAALVAALNRRAADVSLEDHLRRVLSGIDGYLKSPDATKDGGAFEHGAHRTLVGDFWESHASAPRADDPAIDPDVGTLEHPGPVLQRRWAEMARDGLPWTVATRGPRPGMHGCRISDEIQREFGFEPWAPAGAAIDETVIDVTPLQIEGPAPAADDDDAAAFA